MGGRPLRSTSGAARQSRIPQGGGDFRTRRHTTGTRSKGCNIHHSDRVRDRGRPVALGLVASLARPGGNMTGVTSLAVELGPKQLEAVRELVPTARVIALLVNPDVPTNADALARAVEAAAATRGIELHVLRARTESDFDTAFAALPRVGADALMIGTDPFFNSRVEQLVALALRHRIPTIYPFREYAVAGGLLSYGDSIIGAYRVAGTYAGRIVGGEKPSDLPVQQQSTKVELIVNLKTANALGFTVPLALLVRADEVIE